MSRIHDYYCYIPVTFNFHIAPVRGQHATHQGERARNNSHNNILMINYQMDRVAVRMR